MAVFPDPAVAADEVLAPVWLASQLKENKLTLMKGICIHYSRYTQFYPAIHLITILILIYLVYDKTTKPAEIVQVSKVKTNTRDNTFQQRELPPHLPNLEGFLQHTLHRLLQGSLVLLPTISLTSTFFLYTLSYFPHSK